MTLLEVYQQPRTFKSTRTCVGPNEVLSHTSRMHMAWWSDTNHHQYSIYIPV